MPLYTSCCCLCCYCCCCLFIWKKEKEEEKIKFKTNSGCVWHAVHADETEWLYVFSFEFFGFSFHQLCSLTHNISHNMCVKQTLTYPFHFAYFSLTHRSRVPFAFSRRWDAQHEIQKIYSYFNWMLLLSVFLALTHSLFFHILFVRADVCVCVLPDIFRYKMKTIQLSCSRNYVKHSQIVGGVLCNVMMIILAQNSIFL